MTLAEQYDLQDAWRRWDEALALLPLTPGARVLDLGCGTGTVAARMRRLGAEVVGVDTNAELLAHARSRHADLRFVERDLAEVDRAAFGEVDGVWASFVAAYFPDFEAVLARWATCVAQGGFVALTEIDDLFGHDPFSPPLREELERFYSASRASGSYDFTAGRRLATAARAVGLEIVHEGTLVDDELSFTGPAKPEVLEAWRARFRRMAGLRSHFGTRAPEIEGALLDALQAPTHRSRAKVVYVIARSRGGPLPASSPSSAETRG